MQKYPRQPDESVTGDSKRPEKLSDDALDTVAGGFFGIEIVDTCQKRYDGWYCLSPVWGECPNVEKMREVRTSATTSMGYYTCHKGYFSEVGVELTDADC
ncbi:MAG: hypothetical protein EOM08_06230 [Clostridia bacterium]|nr:hypothetical protein [Clostridia bacterium]NCC76016.1 hypothetical protein [Clostridia bacterium]